MKLEDRLASLQPHPPTDDEITHLLATADRRTRRRRTRIATVAALATVAATATLAALPTSQAPTAAAILTTTAQTAAAQDAPAPWTGYRYVQTLELREQPGYTIERTQRWWSDSRWQGRSTSTARLVSGTIEAPAPPPGLKPGAAGRASRNYAKYVLADRDFTTPDDLPNLYGDGALADVPLSELPTDPDRLGKLLFEAQKDGRWTPGGGWDPVADHTSYQVLRATVTLLTLANVTPDQRAALITTLTRYEGAAPLPEAHDRRGRAGRGVMIAGVTIIFDPATSEVLEWSERGETHTFLAAAQVEEIGDTR
jgi:hypothetical protein